MRLSLETVRGSLGPTFGGRSLTTNLITDVQPNNSVDTCCINSDGVLLYNEKFVDKYIKTPAHLFCMLCHEMMHPLMGHLLTSNDQMMNVAADAIINSVITSAYPLQSQDGILFREFYDKPSGTECILRPRAVNYKGRSKFRFIAAFLYGEELSDVFKDRELAMFRKPRSSIDIYNTIKILSRDKLPKRGLLGGHEEDEQGIGKDTASALAEELDDNLSKNDEFGNLAGRGGSLSQIVKAILKTAKKLKQSLLEKFADRHIISTFLELERDDVRTTSPFPTSMSKRDMVLLSHGVWPGYFHVNSSTLQERQREIPQAVIYLDVSGSVDASLPQILGVLDNIRESLATIYTFSTECVEATWSQLRRGFVDTTGGTCFDCVASSIIENNYNKVLIITDGYASIRHSNMKLLRAIKLDVLTILFGGSPTTPQFSEFGPCVQLENVCE